jgi:hypothetical protein
MFGVFWTLFRIHLCAYFILVPNFETQAKGFNSFRSLRILQRIPRCTRSGFLACLSASTFERPLHFLFEPLQQGFKSVLYAKSHITPLASTVPKGSLFQLQYFRRINAFQASSCGRGVRNSRQRF